MRLFPVGWPVEALALRREWSAHRGTYVPRSLVRWLADSLVRRRAASGGLVQDVGAGQGLSRVLRDFWMPSESMPWKPTCCQTPPGPSLWAPMLL